MAKAALLRATLLLHVGGGSQIRSRLCMPKVAYLLRENQPTVGDGDNPCRGSETSHCRSHFLRRPVKSSAYTRSVSDPVLCTVAAAAGANSSGDA